MTPGESKALDALVRDCAERGLTIAETVAFARQRLGVVVSASVVHRRKAAQRGWSLPPGRPRASGVKLKVPSMPPRISAALAEPAAQRGISTGDLARRIVEAVALRGIVERILGDGETGEA